jgi:hypothetical protein
MGPGSFLAPLRGAKDRFVAIRWSATNGYFRRNPFGLHAMFRVSYPAWKKVITVCNPTIMASSTPEGGEKVW